MGHIKLVLSCARQIVEISQPAHDEKAARYMNFHGDLCVSGTLKNLRGSPRGSQVPKIRYDYRAN